MPTNDLVPSDFLAPQPLTADYHPSVVRSPAWWWDQRPLFNLVDVERMRRDPRIQFGLWILRAPVVQAKVKITSPDPAVQEFVERTHKRFWSRDLLPCLKHLEYGSAGGELTYRYDEDTSLVEYDQLHELHVFDAQPLEVGRKFWGLRVSGLQGRDGKVLDLRPPRSFWLANEPDFGAHHGKSRLYAAWEPYIEKRGKHGAVDIRRLWFIKNAYRGGTMRHPPGSTIMEDGSRRSNRDIAREICEKAETGGVIVLPSAVDENGKPLWDYQDPKINGDLTGVREYVKDLDFEIFEGMQIPREVVEAAATGSGWSGRSVPFLVFLAGEDQIVDAVVRAEDAQLMRPLVTVNFGKRAKYTMEPIPLAELAGQGPAQPGQGDGAKPQESSGRDSKELIPYVGPQGGQGYKDPNTGRVSYGKQLALDTDEGRAATENASTLVDTIIDQGAAAGITVADEIRRKVRALVKKKFPALNSSRRSAASSPSTNPSSPGR